MDEGADLLLRGLCDARVAVSQVGHTDCRTRERDSECRELVDAIVRRSFFKKRPESKFVADDLESKERLTAASKVEDGAAALGLDVGPTALGHDHLGVPADTCVRRGDEKSRLISQLIASASVAESGLALCDMLCANLSEA